MTNTSPLQTDLKKRKAKVTQDLEKKAKTVIKRVVCRTSLYLKKVPEATGCGNRTMSLST